MNVVQKTIVSIIGGIIEFGFIAPYLISAKNTELVIGGFASILLFIYIIYKLFKN